MELVVLESISLREQPLLEALVLLAQTQMGLAVVELALQEMEWLLQASMVGLAVLVAVAVAVLELVAHLPLAAMESFTFSTRSRL